MQCEWIIKKTQQRCKNTSKKDHKYCWMHSIQQTNTDSKHESKPFGCKFRDCNNDLYQHKLCRTHFESELVFWQFLLRSDFERRSKTGNFKTENFFRKVDKDLDAALKYFGLPVNVTQEEIKKKYREYALKYHPDKPGGSHDKFNELSKHYNVLLKSNIKIF